MRHILRAAALVAALAACASLASAQSLAINLSWTASSDSTASDPGTVQIYRAPGTCAANANEASSAYVEIASAAPAAGPYQDTTPTAGQTYCYYLTATISGYTAPSSPSTQVQVTDALSGGPTAPTGLTATVVSVSSSSATPAVKRPNPPGIR